jgi:CHAT domain-containing protein
VRYDAELYRELSHRPAGRQTWIPSLAHLQEVLTAETVLLQYYIGKTLDGSTGLYVMLVTREDAIPLAIRLTDLPSSQHLGVEIEGQVLTLGYFGGIASEVRSLVQEEPGPAEAVEEAVESLAQHSTTLLPSNVGIVLRALRESGKTHLCIVPHGALHFFPFHLLPYADGLLADSWAVTYLPSLMMFSPERQPCPPRDCEISSLGLDFEENNPYGLDPLKGAEKEAGEIAAIFNTTACNGATATESAFTAALVHARRVHLSTHGVHAVSAPSFQRVYLAPDQGNDGVFYAYEVLRYDLRGLDLVTLSACETSLGRIDDADNLRGLPANLLIAGARTVVGTLWPVEASAASTFFRSLYSLLQQGESKVVAFRDAQWHTRCLHPQFRDWGAFYYIGNW